MKSVLQSLLFTFLLLLSLSACTSGSTETETPTTTTTETETETVPETALEPDLGHEGTELSYADDWGAFRSALANGNTEALDGFMQVDGMSAADMLPMISEAVTDAMFETDYDKLDPADFNGKMVKEFPWSESFTDDEGNTFESGLYFYFEEQEDGLRLVNFLAAG